MASVTASVVANWDKDVRDEIQDTGASHVVSELFGKKFKNMAEAIEKKRAEEKVRKCM